MPRCIFCLRDCPELTDEHLFPAALGGKLTLKNATCTECAGRFSKAFEQTFSSSLQAFRLLFQIPDRYGNVPNVPAKVEVDGKEHEAKVLGNGTIQPKPIITCVPGEGGVKDIHYRYLTARQKEKLREEARKNGWELVKGPVVAEEAKVSLSGDLDFIGAPEALRTAAKTAYTLLALRMGPKFAMRDLFDGVRHYVQTGDGEPNAKLFFNEGFVNACAQGPHQHSIVIAGRRDKHCIDAIVRFFGGLCYFVNLTDGYEGADFSHWLVYNAQKGEEDRVLVTDIEAEFLQIENVATSKATVWNDMEVSGRRFVEFLDQAIRAKQEG